MEMDPSTSIKNGTKFTIQTSQQMIRDIKQMVVKLKATVTEKKKENSKLKTELAASQVTVQNLQEEVQKCRNLEETVRRDNLKYKEEVFQRSTELEYFKESFRENLKKETKKLRDKVSELRGIREQLKAELETTIQEKNNGEEFRRGIELELSDLFQTVVLDKTHNEDVEVGSASCSQRDEAETQEMDEVNMKESADGNESHGKELIVVLPPCPRVPKLEVMDDGEDSVGEDECQQVNECEQMTFREMKGTPEDEPIDCGGMSDREVHHGGQVGDDNDGMPRRGKKIRSLSPISVASSSGSQVQGGKRESRSTSLKVSLYNQVHAVDGSRKSTFRCVCGKTMLSKSGLNQHVGYYNRASLRKTASMCSNTTDLDDTRTMERRARKSLDESQVHERKRIRIRPVDSISMLSFIDF
ncbi:unnamed protein product [Orchesella dallaii]|uniref:Uncharacterized protein n=1 Tax=Orchesella dallaii TaxID=48710 RepID=A0ABP1Q5S9_9HEXA